MPQITFKLNGEGHAKPPYEPGMHLLEVLREECGVVSAKNGCAPGRGLRLLPGRHRRPPALSCLRKPEQMAGHDITTLEGLPEETRRIISEAFVLEGGVQCGFCIPGIVVRAAVAHPAGEDGRPRRDRQGARRPHLPLHRLRPHHRRHSDRRRSDEERRHAAEPSRGGIRSSAKSSASVAIRSSSLPPTKGHGIGEIARARRRHRSRCSASSPFVDDMRVPGMLHGAMVLSEHPRARVRAIHTEAAAASPGVERMFTARDVPGERGAGLSGPGPAALRRRRRDHLLRRRLPRDGRGRHAVPRAAGGRRRSRSTTRCSSRSPIRSRRSSPARRRCIRLTRFRPAPNVIETPTKFGRGDVEAAFKTAAHVIEATFATQAVDPAFLEPEVVPRVCPQGERHQGPQREPGIGRSTSRQIARVLNLARVDVEIALAASGGAFGAKEELSIQAQTAMAALPPRPAR